VPLNLSDLKRGELLLCIKDLSAIVPYYHFKRGKTYELHSVTQSGDFVMKSEYGGLITCPSNPSPFMKLIDMTTFDKLMYGVE
jgi:hypothetical protein